MEPTAPLRIINCVLSLNRNYDGFVVPRLDAFQNSFPNILTVSGLKTAMEGYPSADEFVKQALRYNDANRARVLDQVVKWLVGIGGDEGADTQLAAWNKLTAQPWRIMSIGLRDWAHRF
jgi:hypothetical protein